MNPNEITQQWIVVKKNLLTGPSYRLMVKTSDDNYYLSNGEVGEFTKIDKPYANQLLLRPV